MKKPIIFIIILVISCFILPAQESWFSLGYEHGYYLETSTFQGYQAEKQIASTGISFSGFNFFNNFLGIYAYGSFLIPERGWVTDYRGMNTINFSDYAMNFSFNYSIGYALKLHFTDDFAYFLTLGINGFIGFAEYPGSINISYIRYTNGFGIASDSGIKFDLTDRVFFRAGCIFTFDFARKTELDTFNGLNKIASASSWDKDFFALGIKPYIAVGINFYWNTENGQYKLTTGKPKKEQ